MILYTISTLTGVVFYWNEASLANGDFTKTLRIDQTTAASETVTVTNISGNFYYAQFTPTVASKHYELIIQKTGATYAIAESFQDKKIITDAIDDAIIETNGSITRQQAESLVLAAVAGRTSGGGLTFKDPSNTSNRIVATVDGSDNRTAITLSPSS